MDDDGDDYDLNIYEGAKLNPYYSIDEQENIIDLNTPEVRDIPHVGENTI